MTGTAVIESAPETGRTSMKGEYGQSYSWVTPRGHLSSMRLLSKTERASAVFLYYIDSTIPSDLKEAFDDLGDVAQESMDEGLDEPSSEAIANARRVLRIMYTLKPYS